MKHATSLVSAIAVVGLASPAFAAQWISPVSGDWYDNTNWDTGAYPDNENDDVAEFGDVEGADAVIEVTVGGFPYPEGPIVISAANTSYNIVRAGSAGRAFTNIQDYTVTATAGPDQTIAPYVGTYRGVNLTNDSATATFYFGGYNNGSNGYATYDNVINGQGNIVVNGDMVSEQRVLSLVKNGSGTYSQNGTYDFMIGYEGETLVQSMFIVNDGVLDIAGIDLNLEVSGGGAAAQDDTPLDASHLLAGEVYTLVDYAAVGPAGLLTSDSGVFFNSVNNLPTGWFIADTGSQIVLTDVPEPASAALMLAGAGLLTLRRRPA